MKALPVQELPEGDWIYEIKFDEYRALYYAFDLLFSEGKDLRLADLRSPSGDPASSKTAIQKLKYLPHLELLECHGTNARNRRSTPLNNRPYQIWSVQQYPVRKR